MKRELLLEIGTEELPAAWLPRLTTELREVVAAQLLEARLEVDGEVETFSTPRRLVAHVPAVRDRQTDVEHLVQGPPVTVAFRPDGSPTEAAIGFARRYHVEVTSLERIATPRGEYLACRRREPGRPAMQVLPEVLCAILRGLSFPKQMRWDARLDDGRGELLFGRPIRWLLFLYGGQVVPFRIRRTFSGTALDLADVRSGRATFGHRFLAKEGRPGRPLRVRSFAEYRARLADHFVVLDRGERRQRIERELAQQAAQLGGTLATSGAHVRLLEEVPDLVEYPRVIAGAFPAEFLDLPEEVLMTAMAHHQHFFPLVDRQGRLLPAFLAVINTEPDKEGSIARNAERVLLARLRDARFFWDADRRASLESRLARLETLVVHQRLGSYRDKARRLEDLAGWLASEVFESPEQAEAARVAARLAKTDLATEMVGEFPELQGVMGGVYARAEGYPDPIWRAIYYHYLPTAVEKDAPPSRAELGAAAVTWAAVAAADKLDTLVGLFGVGERPTGSRDPYGLRRQAHGLLRMLIDLGPLTGLAARPALGALVDRTMLLFRDVPGWDPTAREGLAAFLLERLRYVLEQRGFDVRNVRAVTHDADLANLRPADALHKLEVLPEFTESPDFQQLATVFKRVRNIARELPREAFEEAERTDPSLEQLLVEPAERRLLEELERRAPLIEGAVESGCRFRDAFAEAARFGPAVDRLFTEVFVMVDDPQLRRARLRLLRRLEQLILRLADVSEMVAETEPAAVVAPEASLARERAGLVGGPSPARGRPGKT